MASIAIPRQRGLSSEGVLAAVRSWHYAGGKRDLRIDLIRGFAAFMMIVDHVGGDHTWLTPITGGNQFLVSAAELFVFISGTVMGIVYSGIVAKEGVGSALMKAYKRAFTLYLVAVGLTLTLAAIAMRLHLWFAPEMNGSVRVFLIDVLTLHRTMYLVDIPLMYTLLLLAAAPAILFLSRGLTYVVLGGSLLVWGIWQFSPTSIALPWNIQGDGLFFFSAWQVLFIGGLVIGWHRAKIEALLGRLARPVQIALLFLVICVAIVVHVAQVVDLKSLQANDFLARFAFEKANVPFLRLVGLLLAGVATFTILTFAWAPVRRAAAWLLLPLGQNALTAYSLHLFAVAIVTWLLGGPLAGFSTRMPVILALQVAGVMAVWAIVVVEPHVKAALQRKTATLLARHPKDARISGPLASQSVAKRM